MIAHLKGLLAPPIFEDGEKNRSAALLNIVLVAAFVVAVFLTLTTALFPAAEPKIPGRITVGVVTAALILAMWFVMRRGGVTLASLLFSAMLLVNTTVALYFTGSIRAPLAANYVVCIAVAGLLVSRRAAVSFLLLSLLALLGLLAAETAGLLPAAQIATGIRHWSAYAAVFGMMTVLLGLTTRSIDEALERTRRKERDLAEANAGLQREIAERRRVEQEVRESERLYRLLGDNITDIIWTADLDLKFTYFSPSIAQTGYTVEEAMALSAEEFLIPESLKLARKTLAEELAATSAERMGSFWSRTLELEVRNKNGSSLPAELRITFLRNEEGRPVGLLGVARDTSSRKRLEEQLRKAQELEAIGRLSGGVAHDFNNLLTAITGYSDFLLMELGPHDPRRGDVEGIKEAAERAAKLTQQLLAFSRKQVLQLKVLDLNSVIGSMENMLRRLIGEDVDLATILEPNLGRVKADPGRVEQVIMNLAVNARDAMPQGGKLTIETANVDLDRDYALRHVDVEAGSHVMLAVSDAGVGMDKETQSRLFEPFFTTKENGHGTGLGLSTVYGIVKQSNGHISVYSEAGRGTTFKVYLPRTEEGAEPTPREIASTDCAQGSESILVVEDDDAVRSLACRILKESDYTVSEARDGEEALQICEQRKEPPDLLLTDVVLPGGMSGREIAERLLVLHPEAKVLYMSGYTDDAIVRHGVLDSDIAFLEKPFAPSTLVHKVRRVLDEA